MIDINEENPVTLWTEIWRLRVELKGPDGHATWKDAAIAERVKRIEYEHKLQTEADDKECGAILDIREVADSLHEYSMWCNDELGEICESMINLAYRSTLMSDELQSALCKEMQNQLDWFEENMKVIEVTESFTKTYKELVDK